MRAMFDDRHLGEQGWEPMEVKTQEVIEVVEAPEWRRVVAILCHSVPFCAFMDSMIMKYHEIS
jgi:hypothetical protein